ncbi:MAG: carboxypeptidase-like regulatory domain-containing protein [Clostridia bacterium]|nr:carboxypeptidase-like regulatory domain-containing protein [Clostridia bacterium]
MNEKELIKKYSDELMSLYKSAKNKAVSVQSSGVEIPSDQNTGELTVNVTTLRGLYPVVGAVVTIFKGNYDNMEVLHTAVTDQSGRTPSFRLATPPKSYSESAGESRLPYAEYNISVKSDGYVEQINMNVPVFPGVKSVQTADLVLVSAAGNNKSPAIFDESNSYDL